MIYIYYFALTAISIVNQFSLDTFVYILYLHSQALVTLNIQ